MRVERGAVSEGWVLGIGEPGVVTKADRVGVCIVEPVDALYRIVEDSEMHPPERCMAGMKDVAPIAEDSSGCTHLWTTRAKDSAIVLEGVCRRPLKVEKTAVAAVPGRSMVLPWQWHAKIRPRTDKLRSLAVCCEQEQKSGGYGYNHEKDAFCSRVKSTCALTVSGHNYLGKHQHFLPKLHATSHHSLL